MRTWFGRGLVAGAISILVLVGTVPIAVTSGGDRAEAGVPPTPGLAVGGVPLSSPSGRIPTTPPSGVASERARDPTWIPSTPFPHPVPPVIKGSPSAYLHFYAGAVYEGPNTTSASLGVILTVPNDAPQPDFYYVLLSAWDSAGSYDQLGFANADGAWGVAYSTTTYCAGNYTYDPNATALRPGATYEFNMTVGAGTVAFSVAVPGAPAIWTHSARTGGSTFLLEPTYSCDGTPWAGYTDYEEAYHTIAEAPPYDFEFHGNWAAAVGPVDTWSTILESAPPVVGVYLNGVYNASVCGPACTIVVANEPFELGLGAAGGSVTVEPTVPPRVGQIPVTVTDLAPDRPITLAAADVPPGWNVSWNAPSGNPPFTANLSFALPVGTLPGSYWIGLAGLDPGGAYGRVGYDVTVLPRLVLNLTGAPAGGALDVGTPLAVEGSVSGGEGPYSYRWNGTPAGSSGANATLAGRPSGTGNFTIVLSVTDALGYTDAAVEPLEVRPGPEVTIVPTGVTTRVGDAFSLAANQTGGTGPFRYAWSGLPAGCGPSAAVDVQCAAQDPGTSHVSVTVTDADNETAVANATVTTNGPSPFFLGGGSLVAYAVVGAIAVGVAIAAARRDRRRRSGGGFGPGVPTSPPTGPHGGPGS